MTASQAMFLPTRKQGSSPKLQRPLYTPLDQLRDTHPRLQALQPRLRQAEGELLRALEVHEEKLPQQMQELREADELRRQRLGHLSRFQKKVKYFQEKVQQEEIALQRCRRLSLAQMDVTVSLHRNQQQLLQATEEMELHRKKFAEAAQEFFQRAYKAKETSRHEEWLRMKMNQCKKEMEESDRLMKDMRDFRFVSPPRELTNSYQQAKEWVRKEELQEKRIYDLLSSVTSVREAATVTDNMKKSPEPRKLSGRPAHGFPILSYAEEPRQGQLVPQTADSNRSSHRASRRTEPPGVHRPIGTYEEILLRRAEDALREMVRADNRNSSLHESHGDAATARPGMAIYMQRLQEFENKQAGKKEGRRTSASRGTECRYKAGISRTEGGQQHVRQQYVWLYQEQGQQAGGSKDERWD